MLIAVIDDGIDCRTHPELKLKYDFVVEENGAIHPRRTDEPILTDHGTTCARIIHTYAPEASFCSLGVFSTEKLQANIKQLIAALNWCYEQQIPLIHLSVGSTRLSDYEPLQKIVSRMLCQGQILVAAHSNKDKLYTMPACFSGVLGVAADPGLIDREFRVIDNIEPDSVRLFASARHKLKNTNGVYEETQLANSYAAPTITALTHEILRRRDGVVPLVEIWRELTRQDIFTTSLRPDFIGKSIVYDPAGFLEDKEKHLAFKVLGSFSDTTKFTDALIADSYTPALILPPLSTSDNRFWSKLLECSEDRIGIVCAGAAPQWVREEAPCLLWDERTHWELMGRFSDSKGEKVVPSLYIEPYCEETFFFLPKLKHFFAENGIECLALSDYPQSYLYGVEWAPADSSLEDRIIHICQTAQPDMIICMLYRPVLNAGEKATLTFSDCSKAVFDAAENRAVLSFNPSAEDFQGLLAWMT